MSGLRGLSNLNHFDLRESSSLRYQKQKSAKKPKNLRLFQSADYFMLFVNQSISKTDNRNPLNPLTPFKTARNTLEHQSGGPKKFRRNERSFKRGDKF